MKPIDEIMEVVCKRICPGLNLTCPGRVTGLTCDFESAISAILAAPQVIEVDGTTWKPWEYECSETNSYIWKAVDGWGFEGNREWYPTAEDAIKACLAAAAAIKGGKDAV